MISSPDIFVPIHLQPAVMPPGNLLHEGKGSTTWIMTIGRLKPGVSEAQATAELTVLHKQYLKSGKMPRVDPFLESGSRGLSKLRDQFSDPLKVLMTLVGIVLLIACVNIANLLLARANAREKEIAVRLAIGAGRGRIVRQLLTESLILALLGGALGLLFALWTSPALIRMLPQGQTPVALEVRSDPRVLGFTFGLAVATGLLFGLAPALRATRAGVNDALKQTGKAKGKIARFELGKVLVVFEVALSLLLLTGAGLFIGTLRNLLAMDPGFARQNVLQMRIDVDAAGYPRSQWATVYGQITERVKAIPGVRSVSLANNGLITSGWTASGPVHFPGYTFQEGESRDLPETYIGPDYFAVTGIPLRLGRLFTARDEASGGPELAIVNETLARRYFKGQDPVGKHYGFESEGDKIEIAGVVSDAKYGSLRGEAIPMAYYLWKQVMPVRLYGMIVRTQGDPAALASALRKAVTSIRPDLFLDVQTLSSQIDKSLVSERMLAQLSGFFGLLTVLLACIGLYGVMAYGVTRRTAEIGVRVALGAMPGDVVWMVLRETLALAAAGVVIGVPAALGLSRITKSFLFGLTPNDPRVLGAAVAALLAAGLAAGYLPARRAAHVNPMAPLRNE